MEQGLDICKLEMLNCVVALKLWAPLYNNAAIRLHCDNIATVAVLQCFKGRDPFLQKCAREVWLICALAKVDLFPKHVPGAHLTMSVDAFSRSHLAPRYARRADRLITKHNLNMITVPSHVFTLQDVF
jgi:hypothetical protein